MLYIIPYSYFLEGRTWTFVGIIKNSTHLKWEHIKDKIFLKPTSKICDTHAVQQFECFKNHKCPILFLAILGFCCMYKLAHIAW